MIFLPAPKVKGEISLEEAIAQRRSKRDFLDKPLTLTQLSQILWAAKSVPSAGGLYPLEIYVVVGENGRENLKAGVYHYLPEKHAVEIGKSGDLRHELAQAALGQYFIAEAPITLVIAAEHERTTGKYGQRGIRYVHIEVGHVGENIYLQAETLGLGTVAVGAFNDEEVSQVLNLPENYKSLYIMPIGYPRQKMINKEGIAKSPFRIVRLNDSEIIIHLFDSEVGSFVSGLITAGGFKIFETVKEEPKKERLDERSK